ncbi:GNAT family N-acetyltransferase [Actinomadura barringtoniae]|uniref:GNAT family N-acetyltransferase n=1 Tax=Actinomadura barringtoniae TaxID=1427535 RepID=A0A939T734_9ACTN|nr:GNAT family N-acetyltransferase [Actinomadura barringtoniae]MBO2448912.1 GNAT family N-acetyltransferase [Actinomadura barringtoniae]
MTDDLETFVARAGGFLRADSVHNTVPLTVVEMLRATGREVYGPGAVLLGWWTSPSGDIEGTFLHTRGYPLLLSAMPEPAARDLTGVIAETEREVIGVNGTNALAATFAEEWRHRTGETATVRMRQRLYRLDKLTLPEPLPPGSGRFASSDDIDTLVTMSKAFEDDTGEQVGANPQLVGDRIGYQGYGLWENAGALVSFAGRTRVVADMARVGPVFTPREHRRHGYASAATALISQAALDAGAGNVVLFTDLANPTSNSIYQQLGYRPVSDVVQLAFVKEGDRGN